MSGFGGAAWQLAFQSAPIVLSGGLAELVPGGYLPLIAITEGLGIAGGLLGANGLPSSQNQFFAQFEPLPGTTLIANQLGQYPFANQAVAANAIIQSPLTVSMLMKAPVNTAGGYWNKIAQFTAIKATLDKHSALGGVYLVITPSYAFQNAILLGLTDVTDGEGRQKQIEWQWDFQVPLITQSEAATALNSLLSRLNGGAQVTTASWSGVASSIGFPLQSAAAAFSGLQTAATGITSYIGGLL